MKKQIYKLYKSTQMNVVENRKDVLRNGSRPVTVWSHVYIKNRLNGNEKTKLKISMTLAEKEEELN